LTLTESLGGTYDVTGSTLEAAGNEMNARGEWGLGGARNIAYTTGTVRDDGIVSSVTITGQLFRILPRWTQLSSKSEAVRNEWNRMLGALSGHESRHVSIARTHLNALPAALSAIHESDLPTVWSEKMTALQDAQNEYDTTTTNGQTEGVTLDLNVEQPTESESGGGEMEFAGLGGEG
jgi:predicted secreted Zn-dependent protease